MVFKRYHAVLIMLRIVIRVCISINLILYICIACNMVVQDGINSIFHNIWQALFEKMKAVKQLASKLTAASNPAAFNS